MKLFDITFGNNISGTKELFVKGGESDAAGNTLRLKEGERADFGTYFNLLPHPQYKKYCGAEKFALSLRADGNINLASRQF